MRAGCARREEAPAGLRWAATPAPKNEAGAHPKAQVTSLRLRRNTTQAYRHLTFLGRARSLALVRSLPDSTRLGDTCSAATLLARGAGGGAGTGWVAQMGAQAGPAGTVRRLPARHAKRFIQAAWKAIGAVPCFSQKVVHRDLSAPPGGSCPASPGQSLRSPLSSIWHTAKDRAAKQAPRIGGAAAEELPQHRPSWVLPPAMGL